MSILLGILKTSEAQIKKILKNYNSLSLGRMSFEDTYLFALELINLFEKTDRIADINETFNVSRSKIHEAVKLMKSNDIRDKVIGIDSFISLTHTNTTLLSDLIPIINGIPYTYGKGYSLSDNDVIFFFKWRSKMDNMIITKLNEIRNKRNLPRIKYEEM